MRFHFQKTKLLIAPFTSMFYKFLRLVLPLFVAFGVFAKEVPEKPQPPRLVNDFAGLLSQQEAYTLEQKLIKYNDTTSTQITIVTETSLEGDDAFDYSMRLAEKWGIGQKGKNNGLLIYVAAQEHKIRIQVGYGLEGSLTDAFCKRVIEEVLKPNFKQGSYYQGLNEASNYLIAKASGQFTADSAPAGKPKKTSLIILFGVILVVLYIISKIRGGGNNYGSRGGMDVFTAMMIGSAMGRSSRSSSWGDFSSGGGSFGGFGGGSFGGGGAGGDW